MLYRPSCLVVGGVHKHAEHPEATPNCCDQQAPDQQSPFAPSPNVFPQFSAEKRLFVAVSLTWVVAFTTVVLRLKLTEKGSVWFRVQEGRSQRRPGQLYFEVAAQPCSKSRLINSAESQSPLRTLRKVPEMCSNPGNHLEDKVKVLSPALFTTLMPAAKAPNRCLQIGLGHVEGTCSGFWVGAQDHHDVESETCFFVRVKRAAQRLTSNRSQLSTAPLLREAQASEGEGTQHRRAEGRADAPSEGEAGLERISPTPRP